ncbi:unnamed protein product [Caenorhabditis sp. 36 PRJEB53466]|nr:unnamed protein product [Caenorhabditis sp. 36 PRJEB53466]
MDREKRRSEEEEKELDRRIALIREKNQQIEQRTKEIEEDRARTEDSLAKSPKSSSQTPPKATTPDRNGNGQWSREWDKGKRPPKLGARMCEGSVEIGGKDHVSEQRGEKEGRRAGGAGKDSRGNHKGEQDRKKSLTNDGGEAHKGQRRRGGQKDPKEQKEQKEQNRNGKKEKGKLQPAGEKEAEEKKKGKTRPRRESDNYAVRKVVHRLVEKVCWMERMEKKKAKNELLGEEELEEEEPKSEDENLAPETPIPEDVASEKSPEEEAPTSSDDKEDSNQNVINLVREKVVTMTTSQVA